MNKKALWKDIWKGIWNNKARFLALLAIIILGTGFFGGISATGPNMLNTAEGYYSENKLFDLKVLSTYGIETEDLDSLKEVEDIEIHPAQSFDATMDGYEYILRLYGHDDAGEVNEYAVVSGRLPEKTGEIALDAEMKNFNQTLSIGESVTFSFETPDEEAPALTNQTYKVVGFVNSPLFIEKISRGNTQTGKGTLDGFGVVSAEDIQGDLYSEVYLTFEGEQSAYTDNYQKIVDKKTEEVELALNGRPLERINEIRSEGRQEIFKAEEALADAKAEIEKAEGELASARMKLDEAWQTYEANLETFEAEMNAAETEINRQQAVLDTGYTQYYQGLSEWEAGTDQYAAAKAAWEIQRQALLRQLDTAVTLEGIVQNPIPTPEGEALVAKVQQLLDAETQVNDARAQLDRLAASFQTQEENLRAEEAELQTAETQLSDASLAIQSQKEVLAVHQNQLNYVQQQLQIPYENLTDEDKERMRSEVEGQGNQTLVYQPFLQYINGEVPAAEFNAVIEQEQALQTSLATGIQEQEAKLAEESARIQQAKATLIEQGQQLEAAKRSYTNNVQILEIRSQELQRAKNTLLAEVQSSLQAIQGQINAADNQFMEQANALASSHAELEAAKRELDAGQAELSNGKNRLATERAEGESQLRDARKQIEAREAEYAEGMTAFEAEKESAEAEIQKAETELLKARSDLQALDEPVYFVQDRTNNPGYEGYGDNAKRISSIAEVFPVFFFLIAALISFTTMTRMVDEQRTQIGTLKGLGYSNFDISLKFLVYAASAGIIGTVSGLLLGYWLFPTLIYNAYSSLYNLPDIQLNQYPSYTGIAVIVALLCTVGPAGLASYRTLIETPASIMRPKAPKQGKRVLLERIPVIWNRLNFNAKITIRNLVRYKVRNSITVIGVAGCMALILTGFALSNSISGLAETQFSEVMKYDAVVALKPDRTRSDLQSYEEVRNDFSEVASHLYTLQETYKAERAGITTQDVNVFVPEGTDSLEEFVRLKERNSNEAHVLNDEGAIISEKLADLMAVEPGDEIIIHDEEEMTYRIPIASVTENYTGHYLYLSRNLYQSVFSEAFVPNSDLLVIDNGGAWEAEFAENAMGNENVALVTYMSVIHEAFGDTLESLDVITLVLIISAAALAFVVLYNLTNINVSERIRELSTIKVLGFFDMEVSLYVYRETFILTIIGILLGFGMGNILATVLLKMVEVDFMLFPITIAPISYFYSTVLTLVFSIIVMMIMHVKLKQVDMIEALKSVE
ncbi:FtsX-like permease family protein [Jeotgalibaca sp. A122]|uniref:FtsX-like permease family protein n=1 Tax=Jeotgalibaca sp. A122 TaxID=3457322 RepID=UPI003FD2F8DD